MDYNEQQQNNKEEFFKILRQTVPDFAYIIQALDDTKINPAIIYKVILALYDVANDTKYGNVTIEIENGITRFVKGYKNSKMNEPTIIGKEENTL